MLIFTLNMLVCMAAGVLTAAARAMLLLTRPLTFSIIMYQVCSVTGSGRGCLEATGVAIPCSEVPQAPLFKPPNVS